MEFLKHRGQRVALKQWILKPPIPIGSLLNPRTSIMETSKNQQQAVCGKESIDLLNCVVQSPYDQEKCLSLLQALRKCAIDKKVKKFSLEERARDDADTSGKKQS